MTLSGVMIADVLYLCGSWASCFFPGRDWLTECEMLWLLIGSITSHLIISSVQLCELTSPPSDCHITLVHSVDSMERWSNRPITVSAVVEQATGHQIWL